MPWAIQRQLFFALGAIALLGAIIVALFFTYFYKPATCFDGEWNQDEVGIDCGGSCALLCVAPNISVVWARSVPVASGVYHAVALVRNPDADSGGTISYEMSIFDEENILIARRPGTITIGPGETLPIFEANVIVGERTPSRTFVDITPGMFETKERELSPVRVINRTLTEDELRLTATVQNISLYEVKETQVTALLFNEDDTLISASQTLSGTLGPNQEKTLVFTWQNPFTEPVGRIDIIPRVLENE